VQLTITLAITVGLIAILAGLLRLGFLANFISEPVMKGSSSGSRSRSSPGQIPKLFGIHKGEGDFFAQLWHLVTHLDQTSGITLLVGVASLGLVLGLKRWLPAVPGSLVTVLLGIAAVHVFDLAAHGVKIVGPIQSGLPAFGLPNVAAHSYLDLAPAAIGVMLVGFAEALGAGKTCGQGALRDRSQSGTDRATPPGSAGSTA